MKFEMKLPILIFFLFVISKFLPWAYDSLFEETKLLTQHTHKHNFK